MLEAKWPVLQSLLMLWHVRTQVLDCVSRMNVAQRPHRSDCDEVSPVREVAQGITRCRGLGAVTRALELDRECFQFYNEQSG